MTVLKSKAKQKVAIVGSGMAGLITAHLLHNDPRQRYSVTIFESGESFSLDSTSVSIEDAAQRVVDRVDVPMRAFAEGYYKNLICMYKYLDVRYHPQLFFYSFERTAASEALKETSEKCHFIYSSNNHRFIPIRPEAVDVFSWLIEILYVTFCYLWWSFCCFWIPPMPATHTRECESVSEYIRRIRLPHYFVDFYLLPLLSSVATCSHNALLQFPAEDLTEYKRKSAGENHYTVASVLEVQRKLGDGLEANFSSVVMKVEVLPDQKLRVMWNKDGLVHEEIFEKVILAVAPDVVGKIFQPLETAMKRIPTTMVHSIVQADCVKLSMNTTTGSKVTTEATKKAHTIHFRSSTSLAQTESTHAHPSGAMVITCPLSDIESRQNILSSGKFLRALRTPRSRRVVNNIFSETPTSTFTDEKQSSWKNGEDNVWLVGGWCWDGMVLLEGCVVSAMRVAKALDIDIPWLSIKT